MSNLLVGDQYSLNIPDRQIRLDPSCKRWNGQTVTLKQIILDACRTTETCGVTHVPCPICQAGVFTAWVDKPGLKTNFPGNIFRAKPEWLFTAGKTPCDCPWSIVRSRGCQNTKKHI